MNMEDRGIQTIFVLKSIFQSFTDFLDRQEALEALNKIINNK